jgi:AcrR family transcriptional regulator
VPESNRLAPYAAGVTEQTTAADRSARRRARTRAKLMDAARTLFARQGVQATRINEITEEADVGFGSFYNHFAGKEEIVEAVLAETAAAQAAEIDEVTTDLEDPAEVVAAAHRIFMRHAAREPEWGWLLLRLDLTHNVMVRALGPFASRDLRAGIEAGRFRVPDESLALYAAGGALLAAMRAVLDSKVGPDADIHHAESVLRALGVPADEAAEVARRPLPEVACENPAPPDG